MRPRLLVTVLFSYECFSSDQSPSKSLTKSELKASRQFNVNQYIVLHKADKGNYIVILDKTFYFTGIKETLNDHTNCGNTDIPVGRELKYIIHNEKRITCNLKILQNREIFDKATIKNINSCGLRFIEEQRTKIS